MNRLSIDILLADFVNMKNSKEYNNYTEIELLLKLVTDKLEITTDYDKTNGTTKTEDFFNHVLSDLSKLGFGTFQLVEPSLNQFNFQYLLYIPQRIDHNILLMEGNNGPNIFEEGQMINKKYIPTALRCSKMIEFFSFLNCPCFLPLLPSEDSKIDEKDKNYSEKFPRQLSRNSVVNDEGNPIYRMDLQLLNAMEDAKAKVLAKTEIKLDDKTFLYGFSTSGNLASRLAFLHPDKFCGVCAGGINALIPVPLENYNDTNLIYPVGTYDYEVIVGKQFPEDQYRNLPKLYFIGENEPQKIYNTIFYPILHDPEVRDTFINGLGEDMFERGRLINKIYSDYGFSKQDDDIIKIVPNLEHNPYPMMETMQEFVENTMQTYENEKINKLR